MDNVATQKIKRDVEYLAFSPEHLDLIDARAGQELFFAYRDRVKLQGQCGLALTLVVDNAIVGCGGVVGNLPHVGELWMVCGKDFSKYQKTIFAMTKDFLKLLCRPYHRLEMSVLVGFDAGERFAEALGFVPEGIKKRADPLGRDYTLYAKVR